MRGRMNVKNDTSSVWLCLCVRARACVCVCVCMS